MELGPLFAFAFPLFLLWAAHAGYRIGRLGHGRRRQGVRIRFRLRTLFVVVTAAAVIFAFAQPLGAIAFAQPLGAMKFSELVPLAMALIWFGFLSLALIILTTHEPPDQFEDP